MKDGKAPDSRAVESGKSSSRPGARSIFSLQGLFDRLLKPKLSLLDVLMVTAYCGSFVLALIFTYLLVSSSLVSLFLA